MTPDETLSYLAVMDVDYGVRIEVRRGRTEHSAYGPTQPYVSYQWCPDSINGQQITVIGNDADFRAADLPITEG